MVNFLSEIVKDAYIQIKDIKKEISVKGEKDYVTNCDLIIEKYIINKIQEKFPDITIISEEFNYDKEKCEKYFTIDPIDGTINYVAQNTPWDIEPGLLACIESGAKYYRDDLCTIVANSDDIINCILDSLNTNNKK